MSDDERTQINVSVPAPEVSEIPTETKKTCMPIWLVVTLVALGVGLLILVICLATSGSDDVIFEEYSKVDIECEKVIGRVNAILDYGNVNIPNESEELAKLKVRDDELYFKRAKLLINLYDAYKGKHKLLAKKFKESSLYPKITTNKDALEEAELRLEIGKMNKTNHAGIPDDVIAYEFMFSALVDIVDKREQDPNATPAFIEATALYSDVMKYDLIKMRHKLLSQYQNNRAKLAKYLDQLWTDVSLEEVNGEIEDWREEKKEVANGGYKDLFERVENFRAGKRYTRSFTVRLRKLRR